MPKCDFCNVNEGEPVYPEPRPVCDACIAASIRQLGDSEKQEAKQAAKEAENRVYGPVTAELFLRCQCPACTGKLH